MEGHGKLSQLNKQRPYTVWPHMLEYVIVVISPFLAQRHSFCPAGPKKNLLQIKCTTTLIIKPFFFLNRHMNICDFTLHFFSTCVFSFQHSHYFSVCHFICFSSRVTGGELFEDIVAREYYSEADARYV